MHNSSLRSQIVFSSPFGIWRIANPFSGHRLFCSIGFTYSIHIVWRYGIWVYFKFYCRVGKPFNFSRNLCHSSLISKLLHVYHLWRRAWGKSSNGIPYNMQVSSKWMIMIKFHNNYNKHQST